jgi:arginyl-tRNA--protein-N-Asp/Glu arginylyltransferase
MCLAALIHSTIHHGNAIIMERLLRAEVRSPMQKLEELPPTLADGASCPYPAWTPPARVALTTLPQHPCPYVPGRIARTRALWAEQMAPEAYHRFMDAGFRRSGKLVYQPVCAACRACLPIRIPVRAFAPSKSQRRCARRNADLQVLHASPTLTDEKWELYCRYITGWHQGTAQSRDSLEAFLYESPVKTLEFTYRDAGGRLLAVGICDICPAALSSVYFYFDPSERSRGLGTFGALQEIAYARRRGILKYYLGYWIDQCDSMRYKAAFWPHEVLHPDNVWRSSPRAGRDV